MSENKRKGKQIEKTRRKGSNKNYRLVTLLVNENGLEENE